MYLNRMAEQLTGREQNSAIGMNIYDVYHVKNEETGAVENNLVNKVLKQGIKKELADHTLLISKSGLEIRFDTGAPIFDIDGKVSGLVLTFQDETKKRTYLKLIKENQEKYRTAIAKLESALASMTDAVFITDTEGKIINYNDAFVSFHRLRTRENAQNHG